MEYTEKILAVSLECLLAFANGTGQAELIQDILNIKTQIATQLLKIKENKINKGEICEIIDIK